MGKVTLKRPMTSGEKKALAAVGIIAALIILVGFALWAGFIAALVWGIYDMVVVGFNGWALFWIVFGAVGLLGMISNAVRD